MQLIQSKVIHSQKSDGHLLNNDGKLYDMEEHMVPTVKFEDLIDSTYFNFKICD